MRFLKQFNRREQTALLVCAVFIVGTLFLSLVEQSSLFQIFQFARSMIDPTDQKLRYTGTIITPHETSGLCRYVQFDNKTSEFRHTEIATCFENPGTSSPSGRMNALRDAFLKK